MPRTYPYPTNKLDVNLLVCTDIHHGRRPNWTPGQLTRAGADIDRMAGTFDAILYGGDSINWHGTADKTTGPEDFLAIPWMEQRRVRDTQRVEVLAYGNHDYACWEPPYNNRTITDLMRIYGKPQQAVYDVRNIKVVVLSPDRWWDDSAKEFGNQIIKPSQVTFVEDVLKNTDKPVWLLTHAPLPSHFPGFMTDNGLETMLAKYPNIMGVVSGHRHADIRVQTDHTKIITLGTRKVYAINAPSMGGMPNTGGADPWDMLSCSTAISLKAGGGIEVRFRNHLRETWMHSPEGATDIIRLDSGYGVLPN